MKKLFIGLLLILSHLAWSQVETPIIKDEHPRLDLPPERITWLKQNISSEILEDLMDKFDHYYYKEWLIDPDFNMQGDDIENWNFEWEAEGALEMAYLTAFTYVLEYDELAQSRCNFIADRYATYLNNLDLDDFDDHDTRENMFRDNCTDGALFFDWAYNGLEDETKQNLARAIYRVFYTFIHEYIIDNHPGGDSYVTSHNVENCAVSIRACVALYNADGLSEQEKNDIVDWFQIIYDKWINGILPAQAYFRGEEGGWNWGSAYSMIAFHNQYQFFDDILYATGKNLYEEQEWLKNSINQYWYYFRPSYYCTHFGDGMVHLERADRVIYRHAAVFQDPRSQYLVQQFGNIDRIDNSTVTVRKLIQCDFSAPQVEHPDMPLNWFAPRVGMSVSRTSWDSDATMVWFSSPEIRRADHEHRDNNTFVIIKDKPLIMHSGTYALFSHPHYRNYYSRTIAHNSICVFDSTEQYAVFGHPISNDGGQLETERMDQLSDIELPRHQRARRLLYAATDDYVYNVVNAGLAYDSSKLDRFERRLLYLKPDKVIVVDYLHINNIGVAQRDVKYINHFSKQPNINGDIVNVSVPHHIVSYNGHDYTAVNGNGSVGIRTLWPQNTTTTLVGGDGYEFWVNGKNYPVQYQVENEEDEYDAAAWRIEVEPNQVEENQMFVHTINIGDSINPAQPQGQLIRNENTIGVDWNQALYLFNPKGTQASQTDKTAIQDNNKIDSSLVMKLDKNTQAVLNYVIDSLEGNKTTDIMALDVKTDTYYKIDSTTNSVVVFKLDENTRGVYEMDYVIDSLEGNRTVDIMAFDIKDKTYYKIYVNGVRKQVNLSNDKGIVEFKDVNLTAPINTIKIGRWSIWDFLFGDF